MTIQYQSSMTLQKLADQSLEIPQVLVAMPYIDKEQAMRSANLMESRAGVDCTIIAIEDHNRDGFISMINLIFQKSQSPYFVYVAQDAFAGRDWLKLALTALGDDKHFLGFNDGKWAGALAGFGLARRSWIAKNNKNYFFYSSYKKHYADAEMTLIALQQGVYIYEPNSVMLEVDWQKDQQAVNLHDKALFLERKKNGFDGKVTHPKLIDLFI